jgi:low affinity Fe/Cu permease
MSTNPLACAAKPSECLPDHATSKHSWTETMARCATRYAGSTPAFTVALGVILVWLVTGPLFQYSDTWQLIINTGTTIVTFLMVFLIQRTQNNDSQALHLKLNELIAALSGASSRLLNVEDLSEEELVMLHKHYAALADISQKRHELRESHSIEEAEEREQRKSKADGSSAA